MNHDRSSRERIVRNAMTIVLLTSVAGYVVGWLFTVHLVGSLAEAVWTTSVCFAVLGLYLWGAHRS